MKHAIFALILLSACGGDFTAATTGDAGEAADVATDAAKVLDVAGDASEAADVATDAAKVILDVAGEVDGGVEHDTGAEVLLDVAGEVDADVDVRDAGTEVLDVAGEEAAPPRPLICQTIDGPQCQSAGPYPFICCRSAPCECCNKPNCGLESD